MNRDTLYRLWDASDEKASSGWIDRAVRDVVASKCGDQTLREGLLGFDSLYVFDASTRLGGIDDKFTEWQSFFVLRLGIVMDPTPVVWEDAHGKGGRETRRS